MRSDEVVELSVDCCLMPVLRYQQIDNDMSSEIFLRSTVHCSSVYTCSHIA